MYLLLKMVMFHCHVSFGGCSKNNNKDSQVPKPIGHEVFGCWRMMSRLDASTNAWRLHAANLALNNVKEVWHVWCPSLFVSWWPWGQTWLLIQLDNTCCVRFVFTHFWIHYSKKPSAIRTCDQCNLGCRWTVLMKKWPGDPSAARKVVKQILPGMAACLRVL